MSHSIIPPSSAHIWGAPNGCTGWVIMSQQFPESADSDESKEGTAAHEIAEQLVDGGTRGVPAWSDNFIDKEASNNVIYTNEMFEAAEMYANDVIQIMRSTGIFGGPNLGIEYKVSASQIHDLSWGTPDCFIFDQKNMHLYIWDFKYGFGLVEAFENWQLINYYAGLVDELNLNGYVDQKLIVHLRIIQPRGYHKDGPIREWIVKASDLRGYINTLQTNAEIALSPKAKLNSGSHCKYCSARHACDTALSAGIGMYEMSNKPIPINLTPYALGLEYKIVQRAIQQLRFLESAYFEQIKSLIESGKNVPGWIGEHGLSSLKWHKSVSEIIKFGDMMGYDLKKKQDAITPTQAIKLGVDKSLDNAFSKKYNTGLKLVPDNLNNATEIFKNEN